MGKKRRADAIGRDSHAAKKLRPHHHPTTTAPPKPTRQQHEHYRAANRKKQSILRDLLPKAGMIYPFAKTLMKRPRSDVAVLSAIKNALDTPTLSTALLDDILAAIFHEATDLLQLLQQQKKTYHHHHYDDGLNPLAFTALLRARPALHEPWTRRSADLFARLFLTLRAARLAWRARPRPPFDVGRHCRLARAVDAFVAVEGALDWACPGMAEWLVRGGLDHGWYGAGCYLEDRGWDGEGGGGGGGAGGDAMELDDDDADDGEDVFGGRVGAGRPSPAGEDGGEAMEVEFGPRGVTATARNGDETGVVARGVTALDIRIVELVLDMHRLCLEVPLDLLTEAFQKLSLEYRGWRPFRIGGIRVNVGGLDTLSDDEMS